MFQAHHWIDSRTLPTINLTVKFDNRVHIFLFPDTVQPWCSAKQQLYSSFITQYSGLCKLRSYYSVKLSESCKMTNLNQVRVIMQHHIHILYVNKFHGSVDVFLMRRPFIIQLQRYVYIPMMVPLQLPFIPGVDSVRKRSKRRPKLIS